MTTFRAMVIRKTDAGQSIGLEDFDDKDLMDGDVTVRVEWSTVNYKDGLAITGKAPVVRRFPMIPGIDFAGTVEASTHPDWKAGDQVILNGWGLGETHLGAYGEKARVKGDWLVRLPESMSARDAMAIGTAGYTAMLAVMALEHQGVRPTDGPVLVSIEYRPLPGLEDSFLTALYDARWSRRRTGATSWHVWRDSAQPDRFIEQFVVGSWQQHLRQHERVTKRDKARLEHIREMTDPARPATVTHWLAPQPPSKESPS